MRVENRQRGRKKVHVVGVRPLKSVWRSSRVMKGIKASDDKGEECCEAGYRIQEMEKDEYALSNGNKEVINMVEHLGNKKSKLSVRFEEIEDPDCSHNFLEDDENSSLLRHSEYGVESAVPPITVQELVPDPITIITEEADLSVNLAKLEPVQLMTVPIVIGGIEYTALVDTGASSSLMKRGILEELANSGNIRPDKIRGLGASAIQPISNQRTKFSLGRLQFEESFLVLPENSLSYSVVLGNTFFSSNKVTVEFPHKLSGPLSSGYWEYYSNPQRVVVRSVEVLMQESQVISSVPKLVGAYIDPTIGNLHGQEYFFEANLHCNVSPKVSGESGIVELNKNCFGILLEADVGPSTSKVIRKGTRIGYLSSIIDLETDNYEVNTSCLQPETTVTNEALKNIDLSHLSQAQSSKILDMITQHSVALSEGDHDIGCAGITSHHIELHDETPIRIKARRFSETVTEEIDRQCEELRQLGIIKYSKSPWSAPVVPIRKKDGTLRLCIDYRKLNSVTKADRFPMPNMTDLVFSLRGTKYFTTLDLVRGYYQVPLDPGTSEFTAFSTPNNHYEFKRLAFGLKNAPAAFQREMRAVLRDFDSKEVVVYIDDIMVLGANFEEHLDLVGRVLKTLITYGMKVKPTKCSWFQSEVQFLGHIVSSEGVRKSADYTKSVVDFPRPETIKKLRSFMGLVNFQRKFISNCSVISRPLNALLKLPDKTKLEWTGEMQEAFKKLKIAMVEDIQLIYPDYASGASPLEVATDASMCGAGASLSQVQDGQIRVIAYASTTFNPAQRNYSTIEQELEAIRWAVSVFRNFILGVPFVLHTDHRPLVYMANMTKCNSRIMRTFHELSEYDFLVKYRPGKINNIADTLSRIPENKSEEECLVLAHEIPEGLKSISTVDGGPDSLLVSLWECLQHHKGEHAPDLVIPADPNLLRKRLAFELKECAQQYGIGKQNNRRMMTKMWSYPGCLPPPQFIDAFCNLFNLEVWLHHNFGLPVLHLPINRVQSSMNTGERIHIQSKAGVHYNPLRESKLYKPDLRLLHGPSEIVKEGQDCLLQDESCSQPKTEECAGLSCNVARVTGECSCGRSPLNGMVVALINIDGSDVCAIIDSGAQISLLSEDVWDALNSADSSIGQHSSEQVNIKSLGKSSVSTQGCVSLDWRFSSMDEHQATTFALVAPNVLPACALIGANVIDKLKIKINYERKGIYIDDVQISTFALETPHALCIQYCLSQENLFVPQDYIILPGLHTKITNENLKEIQKADKELQKLSKLIRKKVEPRKWNDSCLQAYKRFAHRISLKAELLVFSVAGRYVTILPKDFVVDIAMQTHSAMTHPGKNKLLDLMKSYCWHPLLSAVVSDVCFSCESCQVNKVTPQLLCPPITRLEMKRPFELIAADLVQLPRTRQGNIGCLVVVDHFTKWASVCPIKNKRGDTIATCLLHRVLPNLPRVPERILTDNGPEFISKDFEEVLRKYGIIHAYSTPHKPSANGAVERLNRTLIEMIRSECGESEEWDECLPRVLLNYNNSIHSSTGFSPSENILSKSHLTTPAIDIEDTEVDKRYWKQSHPFFQPFIVGDWVLKKVYFQGNLSTNKLKPRYEGPYQISKVNNNGVSYVLKKSDQQELRAHHSQLKRYIGTPEYLKRQVTSEEVFKKPESQPSYVMSDYSTDSDEESDDGSKTVCDALEFPEECRSNLQCTDLVEYNTTSTSEITRHHGKDLVPRYMEEASGMVRLPTIPTEIVHMPRSVDWKPINSAVRSVDSVNQSQIPQTASVSSLCTPEERRLAIPLATDRSLVISEFYRLLSIMQEVMVNQSRALSTFSGTIQENANIMDEELSTSSLRLQLSPMNETTAETNRSEETLHSVSSTSDNSSESASLLTLLHRMKEKWTPGNNPGANVATEPTTVFGNETTNSSKGVDEELSCNDAQHELAFKEKIDFEKNGAALNSQRTSVPVIPRYFTRSHGPVPLEHT